MKFWDSSAILPLCLEQPRSAGARAALSDDPEMVVWWGSPIECASAIERLHRESLLSPADEAKARSLLETLRQGWFEVQPGDAIRAQALRLLRIHPLRVTEALQLAAALEWSDIPASGTVVTFDDRLRAAAHREGFLTS